MTGSVAALSRLLSRWRLQRLSSLWLEGATLLLPPLAAYVLAAFALDRWLTLPQAARWTLFAGGAAGILAGGAVCFLRPLRLLSSSRLLRDAGARYPQASAYLHSAWELSRSGVPAHVSSDLVREHLARTERIVGALPAESAFPWSPGRRAVRRLVVVAALWAASTPWLHGGAASMGRVLAPWRDVSLDREVAVEPGDRKVLWAQPVEIRVRWRSARPDASLTLWARSPDSDFGRVPWDGEGVDGSGFRVAALTSVMEYRVGHKDLRTRVYRLTPLAVAHLTDVTVKVRLPGREPGAREERLEARGEIAALRGSWVTLRGKPDRPIGSARLLVSSLGSSVDMKPLPSGEWEGGFPLDEDGTLRFDLTSAEGVRDPDPAAVPLRVLEDRPPTVELLSPAFELEVSPKEKLPLTFSAGDDYGLGQVSLVVRLDGAERETVLRRFKDHPLEHLGEEAWDLSALPSGRTVEFWLKAVDDRRPSPQSGVSSKGVLRLVDFETAHAGVERRWLGAEQALSRLAAQERDMGKLLAEASTATVHPNLLRTVREADGRLAQEWDRTVEGMEELASSMRDDPYANPGMGEMTEALAQILKGLRASELAEARADVRQGDWPSAREGHARLEQRLRKAAELLASGRELQTMQDLWTEAHRLDQAGGELAEGLERMAQGKPPSPEERRKLDEALQRLHKQMEALGRSISALPKADPGSLRDQNRKVVEVPLAAAQRTMDALQAALARGDYAAAARIAQALSEQLSRVRQGLAQAAGAQAAEQDQATARLQEALALWKEVVGQQTQGLEMTAGIEDSRVKERLEAQQELLRRLAVEQEGVARDAASMGSIVPGEVRSAMGQVLKEFRAGRVQEAPGTLEAIGQRLAAELLHYPPLKDGLPPPGKALAGLAEREEAIGRRLAGGAAEPAVSESQLSDMFAAGAMQRQVSKKTAGLQQLLESMARDSVDLPSDAIPSVQGAQSEQEAAEKALGARDSGGAKAHQEKALEYLDRGRQSCQSALRQQQSIQQSSALPFSKPRGFVRPMGHGQTGADTGFVPLPGVEDYQPPREIRREVEKSLRERRPKEFDEAVNEYLKRMSR